MSRLLSKIRRRSRLLAGALSLPAVLAASPALAADDWTAPIKSFIETLTSGLGNIGAGVLGLGIIALGLWAAMSGRMDWNRFAFSLIGGLLVMAGPSIVSALFAS
ncbi:TrbC/VirB2 family protein [Rhodospirillum sp. A1_3_36]|uniref:TrbC/VirB2 family protein n=1 Tax=Rhodospirillum sp. A1_3_36 TaxID=3391666 RepID=UPI0039A48305